LFLGDSITCNCWAVADFPREAFGPGIHALRPEQYPMFSEGGTPSLLSGSALETSPYGISVIRKWLEDFPTVKYVGLSYGTNDASRNIPAATYCSNMQALVQEVIAAGKTPIVSTIVASPSTDVQANAPRMNACLVKLKNKYPAIIEGPDFWSLFQGHSVRDGWFFDSLHPSLSTGCTAWKEAWIKKLILAVYPQ
jgi:lysophospholipase L1-like esterase